jgi:hypothetical protein
VGVVIILLIAILGGAAESKSQGEAQVRWESTFRCNRCGNLFIAAESVDQAGDLAHLASDYEERRWLATVNTTLTGDAGKRADPYTAPTSSLISRS